MHGRSFLCASLSFLNDDYLLRFARRFEYIGQITVAKSPLGYRLLNFVWQRVTESAPLAPLFKRVNPRLLKGVFLGATALTALFVANDAGARVLKVHKHGRLRSLAHRFLAVPLPEAGIPPLSQEYVPTDGTRYELRLTRSNDDQSIDVVYRIGDVYIPQALDSLNAFLRDSHNGTVASYDPRTFDVLHTILAEVNHSGDAVNILSGFRSQETNDMLRAEGGTNAALHSQHIVAKALDIRVPGVSASSLRDAALSLHAGGVGYYPASQFVHIDVGPVRQWAYAPRAIHRRGMRRHSRTWNKRAS